MIVTAADVGRWAVYHDGTTWLARAILSVAATRITVSLDPTVTTNWTKVVMVGPMEAALALMDRLNHLADDQAAEVAAMNIRHAGEQRAAISALGGEGA